jgi:hypothetical protein
VVRRDVAARRIDLEVPMEGLALCGTSEAGEAGCAAPERGCEPPQVDHVQQAVGSSGSGGRQ